MAVKPVKAGIIGCGAISGAYLNAAKTFEALEVAAVADLAMERAQQKADEFQVPKVYTVEQLLADGDIEIVLNLTVPKAHAEVNLRCIEAGKSVHLEKPFACNRADGKKVLDAAKAKGVRVGCAPDTFLGAGMQTCRKVLDDGWIGEPVAAVAFMQCHGHESWHPDPEFYYEVGGGPMFDMGPYYLTALINLLGPVKRVCGSTRVSFPERVITSQKKFGKRVPVEVPTHVAGVMDFASGAIGTIVTSFDIWGHNLPRIEVYGTAGSMYVPDPNWFGGQVWVMRAGGDAKEVPLAFPYADNFRGIGAADMAYGLRTGRPHRCSAEMAFHVLDIMQAFHESSDGGKHVQLTSTCERPAPLPLGLTIGKLDE